MPTTQRQTSGNALTIPDARLHDDPLDEDAPLDHRIGTTRRGLVRLATVAAETATRFAREDLAHDPVAWMLTPRAMFGGRAAIEACLERSPCVRAILLHGLSLGLDAPADAFDDLVDHDVPVSSGVGDDEVRAVHAPRGRHDEPRLYTLASHGAERGELVQTFRAVVADGPHEAAALMDAGPEGPWIGTGALVEGFDPGDPLVEALVSPAMADMLAQVAAAPTSPLAAGLSIRVEQRFAA